MRSVRLLLLFAAAFLTQTVMAQPGPPGNNAAFGALVARVEALENGNSSVEGRTYCMVLTQLRMLGSDSNPAQAQLRHQVVRRTATFSGGVIDAKSESRVRNIQDDTGAVTHFTFAGMDVLGTYIQTGNKLDITIPVFGIVATWYVSKDGSVIHGTLIERTGPFGAVPDIFLGLTRNWTLVENDTCDAEGA